MAPIYPNWWNTTRTRSEVAVPIEMGEDGAWEDRVKGMLKAELKRRNVTYTQLASKLADLGVVDTEPNIRNKLARGKFTAVFLI